MSITITKFDKIFKISAKASAKTVVKSRLNFKALNEPTVEATLEKFIEKIEMFIEHLIKYYYSILNATSVIFHGIDSRIVHLCLHWVPNTFDLSHIQKFTSLFSLLLIKIRLIRYLIIINN